MDTIVPSRGLLHLSLEEFLFLVSEPSLRNAEIVSIEQYCQSSGAITRRFLVLEIQTQGRKSVFLRLDRRRQRETLIARFLLNRVTPSKDIVRTRY